MDEEDWIEYAGREYLPPPHIPIMLKDAHGRVWDFIEAGQASWGLRYWQLARTDQGWIPWGFNHTRPANIKSNTRIEVIILGLRKITGTWKDFEFRRRDTKAYCYDMVAYRLI